MGELKQPPIGLTPKYLHDEQRLDYIVQAMDRYMKARMKIPIEWMIEYNELV